MPIARLPSVSPGDTSDTIAGLSVRAAVCTDVCPIAVGIAARVAEPWALERERAVDRRPGEPERAPHAHPGCRPQVRLDLGVGEVQRGGAGRVEPARGVDDEPADRGQREVDLTRDATVTYVKTPADDLHGHAAPHPVFKTFDGYQWVLLLSGHSARHTAQIAEVKTAPGYPAK